MKINHEPLIPDRINNSFEQRVGKLTEEELQKERETLKKVTKDFEAIFLNMMMKSMRDTLPEGEFMEKSFGRKIYEEMQDEKMAEEIAKGGGIGLAKELYDQLSKRYYQMEENLVENTMENPIKEKPSDVKEE